jgi:hypothetical protein
MLRFSIMTFEYRVAPKLHTLAHDTRHRERHNVYLDGFPARESVRVVAMIYEDSGVKARPHKSAVRAHQVDRVYAFWVVLEGGTWTSPLTVSSPEGRAAIALYSEEEEARMFGYSGRKGAKGCVRVTSTGGVLSLLYGPWFVARHVALDPFPEILGSRRLLEPLTLDRERFARSFAGGAGAELIRPDAAHGDLTREGHRPRRDPDALLLVANELGEQCRNRSDAHFGPRHPTWQT